MESTYTCHFVETLASFTLHLPSGTCTLHVHVLVCVCACYMYVYLCLFLTAGAAEIVRSVCLAVAHLHHMHIAHRDLKVMYELHVCVS